MPYATLSPARFGLLCKSGTGFAVLASLLFVGIAPPSLAQSPLAIPSNLGSAPLLASGPPRVTVHRGRWAKVDVDQVADTIRDFYDGVDAPPDGIDVPKWRV
jgi:hypothetical protein